MITKFSKFIKIDQPASGTHITVGENFSVEGSCLPHYEVAPGSGFVGEVDMIKLFPTGVQLFINDIEFEVMYIPNEPQWRCEANLDSVGPTEIQIKAWYPTRLVGWQVRALKVVGVEADAPR